jgi:ABC-type multidrug transport system ATPase subunit/pSer/pThr/pTyr-binding forkhead associated (FHA) protein
LEVTLSEIQDHLIVTKGPRVGEIINLSKLPITIGREESVDFPIKLENISRKHLRISKGDAGYLIEDLNSSNGTYVNETHIDKPYQLKDGDKIALGPDFEARAVIPVVQKGEATIFRAPSTAKDKSDAKENGEATAFMKAPVAADQTMAFVEIPPMPVVPPRLVINESGQEPRIVTITTDRVRIGRQDDNEVVLNNHFVSRHHADLEKRGQDYFLVPSTNVSNTLLLDGEPVMVATRLHNGAKIRVGGYAPGEITTIDFLSPANDGQQVIKFKENKTMTIGRDASNVIVLSAPAVSRFHAEVEKVGQRFRVRDLRSSNGTFVNGSAITGETWVHPGDAIQVGPYRFVVDEHELSQSDQSEGVSVDIIGLNKWVNKSLNILQDISLAFKPKEFVVVVGQSGGGKSTLVDAIAGYRQATHGKVIINKTIDIYKEFDAIRSTIGFVPQKDIIHMELTVFQALDFAAKLRMPPDTTNAERVKRIEEVMDDLDLGHRRDTQISQLSGGQQKRVSIGVELLTKPGLFFLDEPTSGLDPGMETELMRLMRRLADQGRTIVMITHATKNVMLADKVVFLARGGYLTWFGPPEEALAYFDIYRTERDRRAGSMEFDHIYTLLDNDALGTGAEWAERFRKNPAYTKYISDLIKDDQVTAQKKGTPHTASKPLPQRKQVSAFRQFLILSQRNIKIMTRDKFGLVLLLLTAPLMASLDFVLASGVGRGVYTFASGNFNNVIITLIVLTNTTILVGGLAFMRELVKERDIYKRERMVNLQLSSYIMSKIWIALLLAFYQAACYTVIRYLAFDMPGDTVDIIMFYITVYLLIVAGMMLGLFASALAPNANTAPLLLILFVIPQMVLSGALVSLPVTSEAPASSHWAFQAFVGLSGAGSDVARDSCWALPESERNNLTLDEKNSNCICMGENALRESSCSFPGLGKYYDKAIDEADPIKPAEPGAKPIEPILPQKPADPQNPNSVRDLQTYLGALNQYNADVSKLQDGYKEKINAWQDAQEQYKNLIETYQKDLTELKVKRALAIGSAEATIQRYKEDYGWTFLDKKDRGNYLGLIIKTWIAQLIIIAIVFTGTVIMQKRRDVA